MDWVTVQLAVYVLICALNASVPIPKGTLPSLPVGIDRSQWLNKTVLGSPGKIDHINSIEGQQIKDDVTVNYTLNPDTKPGQSSRGKHPRDEYIDEEENMPDEQRLMRYLFRNYEKTVRPVRNASTAVEIRMGLTMAQIFDMDEKDQVLVTNVWLDQEWVDEFMKWDPAKFANITMLRIPCDKLWLPDIVLYNNAAEYTDGQMPARAMVQYDGNVFWPIPTKLQSSCKVDVTYFPFDEQKCKMKFGSWTYDGFQVNIVNRTSEVDLSNYVNNGEWMLLKISIVRNVMFYACCIEPFPDVTFYIEIRRRTLYYMYNVIFPCIMMSALTLLVFCLPPDSGEKIALGITVLLAFSVFMLAVAENLPETSEFVPLISIYLTTVMALTSMSVIMTVFVLNLHHRGPSKREVPRWIKDLLLRRLAPMLCLQDIDSDAGRYYDNEERFIKNVSLKITLDNIQQSLQNETIVENSRGGMEVGGVSMLQETTTTNDVSLSSNAVQSNAMPSEQPIFRQTVANNNTCNSSPSNSNRHVEHVYPTVHLLTPNNKQTNESRGPSPTPQNKPSVIYHHPHSNSTATGVLHGIPTPSTVANMADQKKQKLRRSGINSALSKTNEEILNSLKRILEKHEREDRDYEVIQEWRRVAQCMDRILFFIFLVATVSSTIGLLVLAPALQ